MKKVFAVVLILASYTTGQSAKTTPTPKPVKPRFEVVNAPPPPSGRPGRYQIVFSPHARADVYLLDTETGKIWHPVTLTNAKDANLKGAPEVWVYQDRIDTEQEFDDWLMLHAQPAPAVAPAQQP